MSDKYLSPKLIEQEYGISLSKLYWWIRSKKILHVKIGKSLLVSQKEFEAFLNTNTIKPINEDDYEY